MTIPPPAADALHCASIVRTHARTFHAASRLLGDEKRRGAFALYAFCRVADDIVDEHDAATAARLLREHERRLDSTLAGRAEGPIFRELHRAVARFDVPERALRELVAGVSRDLSPLRHATWADLASYCEGVASSVGEMCAHVFGVIDGVDLRTRVVPYARVLGAAMQVTNILRDVGEDARRGRCYLPADDLAAFGLAPEDVLRRSDLARDERWRPFVAFEIGRARSLYEAARPGIALLAPDTRRCAAACAEGYAGILDAIVANGYDTISTRARLGRAARLSVLWRAWVGRPPVAIAGAEPYAPRPA